MELEVIWWLSAFAALFTIIGIYFRNLPSAIMAATVFLLVGLSFLSTGVKIVSGTLINETVLTGLNSTLSTVTDTYTNIQNDYTRGIGLLFIVFPFYLIYAFILTREEGEDEVSN